MKKTLYSVFSTLMVVAVLFVNPLFTKPASAAFSDTEVAEQRMYVKAELIEVMHAHVRLLQMLVINKLEAQVVLLQDLVDAQNQ